MKTYNFGKIEILRDPRSELKRLVPSSSAGKSNSGFTNIYGYNKNDISEALDNLGFRLPSVQECIYLYSFFKEVNEFEYKRFWVYTEIGTEILLIDRDDDNYIWSNPPESLKYILFAVEGAIPS
jgi:hypothetical protein